MSSISLNTATALSDDVPGLITRADAVSRAAYHLAVAYRDLAWGTPAEMARRAFDPGYGPSLEELETRIRERQSG